MSTSVSLRVLPTEKLVHERFRRVTSLRFLVRGLIPVVVLIAWQLSSTAVSKGGFQLPSPTAVLAGFGELWATGDLQSAIPASLARAGTGLLFGLAIGLVLGVANGLFLASEELFDSSMQIIRTIPFVAVVPLFLVWFGIGEEMKIILIALACSFPVYINTFSGVRYVDPRLIEVGRTFSMSRFAIIWQIILPAALPSILVGLRYAMSTSLLALIIAEQVNSKSGIGHLIYLASNSLRLDLVMVGIVTYAVLGVLVDVIMRIIERFAMPWLDRRKR